MRAISRGRTIRALLSTYLSLPWVVKFENSRGQMVYLPRSMYVLWAAMTLLVLKGTEGRRLHSRP